MKRIFSKSGRERPTFYYALLSASLLVPLLLFIVIAFLDRSAVLDQAERKVADTTDVFEANALNVFETHELIAIGADGWLGNMSWDEIGASRVVNEYLKGLINRYPQVLGIWLVDPNGKLRNSSRDFPRAAVDLSDRDYFIAQREKDVGTFISHVVMGRISAEKNFNIVRRRSSTANEFNGVIVVSVSPDYFTRFWQKTVPSKNMLAGLLRNDLNILAREPSDPSPYLSPTSATALAIRQSDNGSFRTVSVVDGIDRLMAFRRVGAYDAYVIHGFAVSEALAVWYRHLAVYAGFFILGTAALFLSSWYALAEGQRRRLIARQLHQAEKMEALGQLTGQFAHDFGNILTAILLNLESLRGGYDRSAKPDDGLNHAIAAAQQGQKAVRSMLAFARHEPLESVVVEIDKILKGFEIIIAQALGSKSRLVLAIPPDTWPVKVDPIQLELAVLNLAVNARDAMPEGGALRITATNLRLDGERNGLKGEFVALSISDTGSGIPHEVLSRVFDPFFTTKAEGKGTGLGLSQVYSFATACGGTATVESERTKGTTVTIYLPRAIERSLMKEAAEPATADVEPRERKRTAILVVEDEERIRRVVVNLLRERGYAVLEAGTADEALAILPGRPDIQLIFADVRMPGRRDGVSMAAAAKGLRPDIKIILATGYPGPLPCSENASILRKPYRAHQILKAIDEQLVVDEKVMASLQPQ